MKVATGNGQYVMNYGGLKLALQDPNPRPHLP